MLLRPLLALLLFVSGAPGLLGCGADVEPPAHPAVPAPYRLGAPDTVFALPARLEEISGLTWLGSDRLGAVEDERGEVYVIDARSGEVVQRLRFAGGGDYEGIERVGERVFVLRSDGRLFTITDWGTEEAATTDVQLPLHGGCDAEGLAFQPSDGRLLIACKEAPGRGWSGHKTIFAYRPASGTFDPRPAYALPLDTLAAAAGADGPGAQLRAVVRPLVDVSTFKPSALAVHPLTDEIYVLSSTLKALVVLTPEGRLRAAWGLPERQLPQPEGLTFAPDGTLYIASEGRGRRGTLLRFSHQPVE